MAHSEISQIFEFVESDCDLEIITAAQSAAADSPEPVFVPDRQAVEASEPKVKDESAASSENNPTSAKKAPPEASKAAQDRSAPSAQATFIALRPFVFGVVLLYGLLTPFRASIAVGVARLVHTELASTSPEIARSIVARDAEAGMSVVCDEVWMAA